MKRTLTEVKFDETKIRWRVSIEDEPSEDGSAHALMRQKLFLQELVDNPALLALGPHSFQTLRIAHSGFCWVAIAVAIADDAYGSV